MRDIGKNIRKLRQSKNLTQEAFAEKLFVTRQTVSNYENGRSRPDIDMVGLIAEVLETDANAVLYGPGGLEGKKSHKRLLVGCSILAGLLGLYFLLPVILRDENPYLAITVRYFCKVTCLPFVMTLLGWLLLEALGDFRSLKPWTGKGSKVLRYVLAILFGLILLIPIPYCVWLGVGVCRTLTQSSVSMVFPAIPVYNSLLLWLIEVILKAPLTYIFLGAAAWTVQLPTRK